MIQTTVEEAYQSLEHIRQEMGRLARELGTDWFRLHDLLPLLEAVSAQDETRQLTQTLDPVFRAFLTLQQAEERAASLQRQLGEVQSWLQQAEADLTAWESQFLTGYKAADS
jgi:DNA repair ATPase RecN